MQETSLSEQRRQAIETEYEMYLRKEQLRMDFVQEANQMHAQALEDLDKQIQATRPRPLTSHILDPRTLNPKP